MRRTTLAKRARLSPAEREAGGRAVAETILSLPEIAAASAVMAFASFGTEIPTDPVVEALLHAGRRVMMPAVDGDRLRAAPIARLEDLAPGYRGIREPPAPAFVDPGPQAVFLIPGVAFDERGGRLGYGGGFYDSFLRQNPGLRIGVCFECQIVAAVPAEAHDLPVALVVTDARVIRAG
ncbi:MAG TPA: 5-formyltetrahydrofolate cyclo-ligase [Actinomycetota bacterium]